MPNKGIRDMTFIVIMMLVCISAATFLITIGIQEDTNIAVRWISFLVAALFFILLVVMIMDSIGGKK